MYGDIGRPQRHPNGCARSTCVDGRATPLWNEAVADNDALFDHWNDDDVACLTSGLASTATFIGAWRISISSSAWEIVSITLLDRRLVDDAALDHPLFDACVFFDDRNALLGQSLLAMI